jgi:hypothetical protein
MATAKEQARALVAAKMQPMALSKKEQKGMDSPVPMATASKAPRYPWGLSLNLEGPTVKKLKLRGDLRSGQVVLVTGKAKVTRVEETEDESGERCSYTLQITDMALVPAHSAARKGKES